MPAGKIFAYLVILSNTFEPKFANVLENQNPEHLINNRHPSNFQIAQLLV